MPKAVAESIEGAQFVRYFGPLLDALRELGGSGAPSEVVAKIADELGLSDQVQGELMESGAPRFPNQVAWARFYLSKEGLIDSSKRGVWSLTDKGRTTHLAPKDARAIFLKWVNNAVEQTSGWHALAAAAHRERWTATWGHDMTRSTLLRPNLSPNDPNREITGKAYFEFGD